ncbi:MAG: hypothetical protein KW802_04435 [Candidatus Doudnabacteria bacterium]|nr:hypothetical protein [Candidatus Doudnabacteria bacterium]
MRCVCTGPPLKQERSDVGIHLGGKADAKGEGHASGVIGMTNVSFGSSVLFTTMPYSGVCIIKSQ